MSAKFHVSKATHKLDLLKGGKSSKKLIPVQETQQFKPVCIKTATQEKTE